MFILLHIKLSFYDIQVMLSKLFLWSQSEILTPLKWREAQVWIEMGCHALTFRRAQMVWMHKEWLSQGLGRLASQGISGRWLTAENSTACRGHIWRTGNASNYFLTKFSFRRMCLTGKYVWSISCIVNYVTYIIKMSFVKILRTPHFSIPVVWLGLFPGRCYCQSTMQDKGQT